MIVKLLLNSHNITKFFKTQLLRTDKSFAKRFSQNMAWEKGGLHSGLHAACN